MKLINRLLLPTFCLVLFCTVPVWAQANPPLLQKFPSAHVLVHYYCPDCSQSEKDHVAAVASIYNTGPTEFSRLLPSHPEAANAKKIRYRLIQYVQYMTLDGQLNPQGHADYERLLDFAADNGYDVEDFFLHWTEPTRIELLGGTIIYDGTRTTLIDRNGGSHVLDTSRAMAIVWGDFYYLFDWHTEAWYQYILERTAEDLGDMGGFSFDGLFEDVLNGPITDTYQGIVYGGRIAEFGGLTPREINQAGLDHELIRDAQARLNADLPGRVFMPNSGCYTQQWAQETMLAGDGTITEMVAYPDSDFWMGSWTNAEAVTAAGKYYDLAGFWDDAHTPSNYPAGVYANSRERHHLFNAAWYWMMYKPGYVTFDVSRACCDWSAQWPRVMEADIGQPVGPRYLAASGRTSSNWYWELWARDYTKATVYFHGNMRWRGGNGASIGFGTNTGADFALPEGAQILRMDGTWSDAPATITHMDAFGFVVRVEGGSPGDDDTGDDDATDDDATDDDATDDDATDDDSGDDDASDDDATDDDVSDDDATDDDATDDDADDDTGDDDDSTLTFFHHGVGAGYVDNGLDEVAASHGFTLVPVHFPETRNCACDLLGFFQVHPEELTGSVMVESSFYCSNLWGSGDVSATRGCYEDLSTLAQAAGASLYVVSPTPYAREEMEENGWRWAAQLGADLYDELEVELGLLNANRILRDESLPYLDEPFQTAPYESAPNDLGSQTVVAAIDQWLPQAPGDDDDDTGDDDASDDDATDDDVSDDDASDDDATDDDVSDDDASDDDASDDDSGDDDTDDGDVPPPDPDMGCSE